MTEHTETCTACAGRGFVERASNGGQRVYATCAVCQGDGVVPIVEVT